MKINIYVIWDAAAQVYNKPFYLHNDAVAIRSAMDIMRAGDTDIANSPHDFIMFRIGTYDDEHAQIDLLGKFVPVVKFHELKLPEQEITQHSIHDFSEAAKAEREEKSA